MTPHDQPSLLDTIVSAEVRETMLAWRDLNVFGPLIGTLAVGFYTEPRPTKEIRLLVPSYYDAEPLGFRQAGMFRLRHQPTLTRVWLMTSTIYHLTVEQETFIFDSTIRSDGFEIVSPSGLVALLLHDTRERACADIRALLRQGSIDLTLYGVPGKHRARFARLQAEASDVEFHEPDLSHADDEDDY